MISLAILMSFLALCYGQANIDMCYKTANPLGECSCDKQFFVNEDCTQGFLCQDYVTAQDSANDGCMIQCNPGWKLVADPRNGGSWFCTNVSTPLCPGKFNTECACNDPNNCPIGECECDGQLRVSQDCKTAHFCNSSVTGGFDEISCGNNEIVYVNLAQMSWKCDEDDGRCPGAFHVGCSLASGLTVLNSILALCSFFIFSFI